MGQKTANKPELRDILSVLPRLLSNLPSPVKEFERVQTRDPFKVLVATILSARTKDEVTSAAVKRLFSEIKGPKDLEKLSTEEIERLIYPVGFYRNKARFLAALPKALKAFDYKVPDNLQDLLKIPGVGRKTANLVLSRAFGKSAICVDTHVHRIMNMWGFVKTSTPEETEMALEKILPKGWWSRINPVLVAFGQTICKPVVPQCGLCPLRTWCPRGKSL